MAWAAVGGRPATLRGTPVLAERCRVERTLQAGAGRRRRVSQQVGQNLHVALQLVGVLAPQRDAGCGKPILGGADGFAILAFAIAALGSVVLAIAIDAVRRAARRRSGR